MKDLHLELLKNELTLLEDSAKILSRSFQRCQDIGHKKEYSLEELDHFEGLTSRFARLSDILIQKTFRLIEILDLDLPGTVRDRINRAEKKDLIRSAQLFVEIRDLRNDIAHEYLSKKFIDIYQKVMEWTPVLLETVQNVKKYCERYIK